MKKRLLIFTHGGGRLANQLTNHAHLVAFHQEHAAQFDIVNLAMAPYKSLFESTSKQQIPTLPILLRRWNPWGRLLGYLAKPRAYKVTFFNIVLRLIHLIYHLLPKSQSLKLGLTGGAFLAFLPGKHIGVLDLGEPSSLRLFSRRSFTLLAGWPVRSWKLFEKHQDAIRAHFTVRHDFQANAKFMMDGIRQKHRTIIGVLIRQTDYRTWARGQFYFETLQYAAWMREVKALIGDDVAFVVASDEMQDLELFQGLNVYLATGQAVGPAHFIESLAELSMCDFVMTPPSTFGIWAAFLGNVPVIPVYEKGQILEKRQFLANHIFDSLKHPQMSISMN